MTPDLVLSVEMPAVAEGAAAVTELLAEAAESWRSETAFPGRCTIEVQERSEPGFVVRANGTRLVLSGREWTALLGVRLGQALSPIPWSDPAAQTVDFCWTQHPTVASSLAAHALRSHLYVGTEELFAAAGAAPAVADRTSIEVQLPDRFIRDLLLAPQEYRDYLADVRRQMALRYGVTPAGLRFVKAPWAEPVVRLRVGAQASPSVRFDPDDLVSWLQPLLLTECVRHLACWADDGGSGWTVGLPDLPRTAEQIAAYRPGLRRRLLADQVTVLHEAVLVEAILRELADPGRVDRSDADLLDAMGDRVRWALGPALTQPALEEPKKVIELDVDGAPTGLGPLRDELVVRCPMVFAVSVPTVCRVPQARRREVAEALRPLSDVVQVVGDQEVVATDAARERWAAVSQGPGPVAVQAEAVVG